MPKHKLSLMKIAKKILIAHIYLAVVVLTGQVFAQTGTWTPTGSLSVQRRDHTATLLTNGKVLINRGTGGSAELYDPVTGIFSPTGPSLGGGFAQGSTATRLLDGRVLIVGGSPAEIYNPSIGTFSPAGNLNIARVAHTATLLRDGKVLIAGGSDIASGQHLAAVELYDPLTGTFTLTGPLNAGRLSHSATLLSDGRVLIAGGQQIPSPGFSISLSSAELYDPPIATFSPTGNMIQARCCLSFTQAPLLSNGKVLIVGGFPTQAAELFDPATGTFSPTGSMTIARGVPSVTLLSSGQVLVAGGNITLPDGGPGTTNSAEIYDPVSGAFSPAALMIQARQQHTATLLPNGKVLITGGFDFGAGGDLSSAELFEEFLAPPVFDICLQDESNGNMLKINSTTGQYLFTRSGGITLGGTGNLTVKASLIILQAHAADHSVLALIERRVKKAVALIHVPSQRAAYTIVDKNTSDNTCSGT
jgi:Kelch motif